jgi:hypothetical protein
VTLKTAEGLFVKDLSSPIDGKTEISFKALKRRAIINRSTDFWLLGGFSIVTWIFVLAAEGLRSMSAPLDRQMVNLPFTFGTLSLICNYPHFLASYQIAYGRGIKFILRNWFPLIVVPISLIMIFTFSYLTFDSQMSQFSWLIDFSSWLNGLPVSVQLGTMRDLGTEILSSSVWVMFFTVGWHYSKQVFGCMMVYSRYDNYPLNSMQRRLLKYCLFSVAFTSFVFTTSKSTGHELFLNIPMTPILIPIYFLWIGYAVSILLTMAVIIFVFFRNRRLHGLWPTLGFLIPAIAFYVWWYPLFLMPIFYLMVVPFFHSLQYLPFAFKMVSASNATKNARHTSRTTALQIGTLLIVGFMAFDLVPGVLDENFHTAIYFNCQFFTIAAVVFINVHHFFIDSTIWRMGQPEVENSLFQIESATN